MLKDNSVEKNYEREIIRNSRKYFSRVKLQVISENNLVKKNYKKK